MNLSKPLDGSLDTVMRKAACILGGMESSNSRRRRCWRLHRHSGGVCCVFVLCVASRLVVVTRRM